MTSLVHIGLHKTGTTSLQHMWEAQPGVALSNRWLFWLIQTLRQAMDSGKPLDSSALTSKPLFHSQAVQGDYQVFSNEGLSVVSWLERWAPDTSDRWFWALGQVLQSVAHDPIILVTLRSPRSWIKSAYKHYIQTGGDRNILAFQRHYCDYIVETLHPATHIRRWSQMAGADRILFLPMEYMRDQPAAFMAELQEKTGLPLPHDLSALRARNVSIDDRGVEILRRTRRSFNLLLRTARLREENRQTLQQISQLVGTTIRLDLQDYPSGRFARHSRRLVTKQPDLNALTPALEAFLRDEYGPWVAQNLGDFHGYAALYQTA